MAADRTPSDLADRLDEHAAYDLLTPEDVDTMRAAAALLRVQAERLQDSWYTDIGERLDAVTAERNEARRQMQSLTEDYVGMEARAVAAEATVREQGEQLDTLRNAIGAKGNGLLTEIERHIYNERHGISEYARLEGAAAGVARLLAAAGGGVPETCACGKPATGTVGGIPTCGDDR